MGVADESITSKIQYYQELFPYKVHDTNLDELAEYVKKAQGSRSVRQFARDVGTTPSTISRILNKKIQEPADEIVIRIALNAEEDSGIRVEDLLSTCGKATKAAMMRNEGQKFEVESLKAITQYLHGKGYKADVFKESRSIHSMRYDFVVDTDVLTGEIRKWAFDVKLVLPMSPLGPVGSGKTSRLLDYIFARFYLGQSDFERVSVIVNHRAIFEQLKKRLEDLNIRDSLSIILVAGSCAVDEFVVKNDKNNKVVFRADYDPRYSSFYRTFHCPCCGKKIGFDLSNYESDVISNEYNMGSDTVYFFDSMDALECEYCYQPLHVEGWIREYPVGAWDSEELNIEVDKERGDLLE